MEAATAGKNEGLLVRRVAPEAPCDVRLGLEQPGSRRLLLVTIPRSALAHGKLAEIRTAGIEVRLYALNPRDRKRVEIGVRLLDLRYADLFSILVTDLTAEVERCENQAEATGQLLGRLARWQSFLRRSGPDGLDQAAQRGLYGELYCLLFELLPAWGHSRVIEAWTGPDRANQDFRWRRTAVEVKTTAGPAPQRLVIASERQLDDAGLDHLFLYHMSLDPRPGAEETLPALVLAVRDAFTSSPEHQRILESRLLAAGYLDLHTGLYEQIGYPLLTSTFYRLGEGFPRMTGGVLPVGVANVRYEIGLSYCTPFVVAADQVRALLQGEPDV